ncbi:MAG: DNA-binding transcriptional regulator KdgR [Rhodoferax sp.]|jgi:IclR family KDG regulon transcriptional repressor|uniref:DNA-binding transcriptional regulator KdgR n=1 Tax=Rhodoferax sp. TaxID=50421 RepID=UPI001B4A1FC0|nr:DNA-binding transcriptional regulator KdgR [Rhodoferax sp.]MBP8286895.1 DNA-binding transcriptional regulator KdgR [Rhodoferax sp.]MBP9148437.1 DNA-binding transcriptional regulator KdgR [Rhodoferax sp.]MBP9737168.1 DNA-binding transcriptional regulator KdgR [Rhodoferax sp.]
MAEELYDTKQPESVAAVLKVFALLQALSENNETGISDLSVRLAMPKATVYRFLQTMMTLGYVRQEKDSERYGLTMRMFELGTKALQYPDLVELSKNHMQLMADTTGETVHLGTLIDSEIIYIHKVDSRHMLGMYSRVGRRAPLHCTAIGKVLMAWEDPERRERVLKGADFKRYREKTIVDSQAFTDELLRVKAQGYGEDREEFDDHIRCLGVPIFDRLNRPIAGLSISFPTFRYDESKEAETVAMLQGASRDISAQLGCTRFPLDN